VEGPLCTGLGSARRDEHTKWPCLGGIPRKKNCIRTKCVYKHETILVQLLWMRSSYPVHVKQN